MPTSDLDMPLLPSAEQISRREFATVRRGYDPQQVRAYLTSIATQVGTLERELSQLRLEAGSAAARSDHGTDHAKTPAPVAPPGDPYETLSKRFATLIEMADQEAERILENARSDAARTLDEATSEADRIRVDAQAHAEEARQEGTDLLERAKTESDRLLSGLADRRRGSGGAVAGDAREAHRGRGRSRPDRSRMPREPMRKTPTSRRRATTPTTPTVPTRRWILATRISG